MVSFLHSDSCTVAPDKEGSVVFQSQPFQTAQMCELGGFEAYSPIIMLESGVSNASVNATLCDRIE